MDISRQRTAVNISLMPEHELLAIVYGFILISQPLSSSCLGPESLTLTSRLISDYRSSYQPPHPTTTELLPDREVPFVESGAYGGYPSVRSFEARFPTVITARGILFFRTSHCDSDY
jgi:hypothetical protein